MSKFDSDIEAVLEAQKAYTALRDTESGFHRSWQEISTQVHTAWCRVLDARKALNSKISAGVPYNV